MTNNMLTRMPITCNLNFKVQLKSGLELEITDSTRLRVREDNIRAKLGAQYSKN